MFEPDNFEKDNNAMYLVQDIHPVILNDQFDKLYFHLTVCLQVEFFLQKLFFEFFAVMSAHHILKYVIIHKLYELDHEFGLVQQLTKMLLNYQLK